MVEYVCKDTNNKNEKEKNDGKTNTISNLSHRITPFCPIQYYALVDIFDFPSIPLF